MVSAAGVKVAVYGMVYVQFLYGCKCIQGSIVNESVQERNREIRPGLHKLVPRDSAIFGSRGTRGRADNARYLR